MLTTLVCIVLAQQGHGMDVTLSRLTHLEPWAQEVHLFQSEIPGQGALIEVRSTEVSYVSTDIATQQRAQLIAEQPAIPPKKVLKEYAEQLLVANSAIDQNSIAWPPAESRLPQFNFDFGLLNGKHWYGRTTSPFALQFTRNFASTVRPTDIALQVIRSAKDYESGWEAQLELMKPPNRPVLFQELRKHDPRTAEICVYDLGLIDTPESTSALIDCYWRRPELRDAATWSLMRRPFRPEAADAYVDMVRRGVAIDTSAEAVVRFHKRSAEPYLAAEITAHGATTRDVLASIWALRTLQGRQSAQTRDAVRRLLAGRSASADLALMRRDPTYSAYLIVAMLHPMGKMSRSVYDAQGRKLLAQLPASIVIPIVKRFPLPRAST